MNPRRKISLLLVSLVLALAGVRSATLRFGSHPLTGATGSRVRAPKYNVGKEQHPMATDCRLSSPRQLARSTRMSSPAAAGPAAAAASPWREPSVRLALRNQ